MNVAFIHSIFMVLHIIIASSWCDKISLHWLPHTSNSYRRQPGQFSILFRAPIPRFFMALSVAHIASVIRLRYNYWWNTVCRYTIFICLFAGLFPSFFCCFSLIRLPHRLRWFSFSASRQPSSSSCCAPLHAFSTASPTAGRSIIWLFRAMLWSYLHLRWRFTLLLFCWCLYFTQPFKMPGVKSFSCLLYFIISSFIMLLWVVLIINSFHTPLPLRFFFCLCVILGSPRFFSTHRYSTEALYDDFLHCILPPLFSEYFMPSFHVIYASTCISLFSLHFILFHSSSYIIYGVDAWLSCHASWCYRLH